MGVSKGPSTIQLRPPNSHQKCAAAHEEWLSAQPQSCASSGMAMATPHTPQIAIGAPMLTFVMLRSRAATEAAVMLSP